MSKVVGAKLISDKEIRISEGSWDPNVRDGIVLIVRPGKEAGMLSLRVLDKRGSMPRFLKIRNNRELELIMEILETARGHEFKRGGDDVWADHQAAPDADAITTPVILDDISKRGLIELKKEMDREIEKDINLFKQLAANV